MKGFLAFIYAILVVFTTIGGAGYLFWIGQPQFAVPLIGLGVWQGFAFFGKCELPTKTWLNL